MKLSTHRLTNFKGIKDFTLDTQGQNVSIYGENATGKTSLYDAFLWLLFGKDSQNKTDFAIKTLDENGNETHGLEHAVETVLCLGETPLTLRKVYQEKWTKKRGAAKKEFTGHTTDHFINGVPVKKGEFEARISNIASEGIFKLLTSPTYFNEYLPWKDRREILLQVCGDITDDDVIASNKNLAKLPDILNGRKLDDHRKVIQSRRTEINKELDKIPVRINEAERAMPDISTINKPEALQADIKVIKESIKKENEKLARLESGGEAAEKTKKLREIEAEIIRLQNEAQRRATGDIAILYEQLNGAENGVVDIERHIKNKKQENDEREKAIKSINAQIEELRDRWHGIAEGAFNEPEQDGFCPTCGQALPAEQVRAAIDKALATFNKDKATQLESINAEGKVLKEKKDSLQAEYEATEKVIQVSEKKLRKEKATIKAVESEIEALRCDAENQKEDPAVELKLKEKALIEEEIKSLKVGDTEAREKILGGIKELEEILSTLEECQAKVKMRKDIEKRIEDLKAQEQELAAEYERLEGELYLTEEFIRQKVSLLEERINSKFEMARFKLFNVLVNGSVEECCETTYQGVPFSSLNNGARINVGLDIIRTLAKHYSFYPPIFIDNREAVTSLIDMGDQQMINLIVSEQDKALRVEAEGKKEKGVA
jgi:DNA repair exonuclease SbcCD ATPase subunit